MPTYHLPLQSIFQVALAPAVRPVRKELHLIQRLVQENTMISQTGRRSQINTSAWHANTLLISRSYYNTSWQQTNGTINTLVHTPAIQPPSTSTVPQTLHSGTHIHVLIATVISTMNVQAGYVEKNGCSPPWISIYMILQDVMAEGNRRICLMITKNPC